MEHRTDLYARTGTHILSSDAEIRAASRRASKATHPDHGGSGAAFAAQRDLFDVLTRHRAAYDETVIRSSADALIRVGRELQSRRLSEPQPGPARDATKVVAAAAAQTVRPTSAGAAAARRDRRNRQAALNATACLLAGGVGAAAWLHIHGLDGRYVDAAGAWLGFTMIAASAGVAVYHLGVRHAHAAALAVAAASVAMILAAERQQLSSATVQQALAAGFVSVLAGAVAPLVDKALARL